MDLRLHAYLKHLLLTAHHLESNDTSLPEPIVEKMLEDLRIQLERRLLEVVLDQLSPGDQEAYGRLMQQPDLDQQQVVDFLQSKVPNATELIQHTLEQFSADYIATVNYQPKS